MIFWGLSLQYNYGDTCNILRSRFSIQLWRYLFCFDLCNKSDAVHFHGADFLFFFFFFFFFNWWLTYFRLAPFALLRLPETCWIILLCNMGISLRYPFPFQSFSGYLVIDRCTWSGWKHHKVQVFRCCCFFFNLWSHTETSQVTSIFHSQQPGDFFVG